MVKVEEKVEESIIEITKIEKMVTTTMKETEVINQEVVNLKVEEEIKIM